MSHELRTPLNGILGFINLLDKTKMNDNQRDYLHTIQKSARSLLSIINDILDFSKIEAGKLQLDLLPMDIRECVEDTLTLLGPSAHEKSLEIVPFIYSDVPSKINGDSLRIKQVITNLVSNAIKFTQSGSVVIRVMLEHEENNTVTLCISVTDTGIGLSEDQKKQLFHAFNQANPSITRKFGGTGLGLVICKRIVEQMHGTIDLESEPGVGTTFWFTLQAAKLEDFNPAEESELRGFKILLYEKHTVTRLALMHLLEHWGLHVNECDNIDEVPIRVRNAQQSGEPFKIALIGINKPLDEKHLLSTIACPVGVLVNTTEQVIHNDLMQAGASLCLAKPVCRRKLYDALCNVFSTTSFSSSLTLHPLPSLNVLAVDDNPANLKLVNVFLENIGVIPTLAQSGYEALQLCREQTFDLILMDLHMPGIDGIETAIQIRASDGANATIPIVALSAHILINEQDNIREAGMNDFLPKPIDENSLRASIYKWTHSGFRSQDKDQKVEVASDQDLKTIDWTLCLKLAGNKEDLAQEMLDMLVTGLPTDHTNISHSYTDHDFTSLRNHVHRLHGACCYVGVPKLKSIAKALETAIINSDTELVDKLINDLDLEIGALLELYSQCHVVT